MVPVSLRRERVARCPRMRVFRGAHQGTLGHVLLLLSWSVTTLTLFGFRPCLRFCKTTGREVVDARDQGFFAFASIMYFAGLLYTDPL